MTDDNRSEQEARIERLKAQAAAASDGPMACWESADALDPDLREEFWRGVVAFESAGTTDLVKELTAMGVPLPDPETLDDAALHAALCRVIDGLDRLNVFLEFADHLNDRELYTKLVREILPEEMDAIDAEDGGAWHIPVLGHTPEEQLLYLKYYASEREREHWRDDFPGDEIPDHVDPPYPRD